MYRRFSYNSIVTSATRGLRNGMHRTYPQQMLLLLSMVATHIKSCMPRHYGTERIDTAISLIPAITPHAGISNNLFQHVL
jgi:hypothetical protein